MLPPKHTYTWAGSAALAGGPAHRGSLFQTDLGPPRILLVFK